jgi:hypothetical protein
LPSEKHVKRTRVIFVAEYGRKLQERRPFRWIRNFTENSLSVFGILNPTKLLGIITDFSVIGTYATAFEFRFI